MAEDDEQVASNWGWTMKQGGALQPQPFRLAATDEGTAFFEQHIKPVLPLMWAINKKHFPATCAAMETAVPRGSQYRLHPDVPVTKVTLGVDNPTRAPPRLKL